VGGYTWVPLSLWGRGGPGSLGGRGSSRAPRWAVWVSWGLGSLRSVGGPGGGWGGGVFCLGFCFFYVKHGQGRCFPRRACEAFPGLAASALPGPEEPHIAGSRLEAKAIFCSPAASRGPAPGVKEAGWAGPPHRLPPQLGSLAEAAASCPSSDGLWRVGRLLSSGEGRDYEGVG